ncbi:hypothetical protein HID58_020456, partial [Brassica napus]
ELPPPLPPANHSLHLPTPTLDAESQSLLQSISAQGGYAYARMAALAVAGDQSAAEAARDMAWEQLHSGPWHSVLPVWRDAYSMACLHVAKFHFAAGEFGEALGALDMGLIMGGRFSARTSTTLCSWSPLKLVLKILPLRSLTSGRVDKRSDLSMEGFLRDYFQTGTPVVITNCMAHWPARTKWNHLDYLTSVAGNRTVPVEVTYSSFLRFLRIVGKNYLCSDWKQELVTFSKFLERMRTNRSTSVEPTYLAQHPLFDQVVGKKYIRLYPSSLQDELYPYSETMLCNSSQVDLDNIDKNEFPKVVELEFMDCILEEGEMLYIPPNGGTMSGL